jgi:hypothetical protein
MIGMWWKSDGVVGKEFYEPIIDGLVPAHHH